MSNKNTIPGPSAANEKITKTTPSKPTKKTDAIISDKKVSVDDIYPVLLCKVALGTASWKDLTEYVICLKTTGRITEDQADKFQTIIENKKETEEYESKLMYVLIGSLLTILLLIFMVSSGQRKTQYEYYYN